MTKFQLYRQVKSLARRRKVAENLPELEAAISGYLLAKSADNLIVAGYLVKLAGEKLILEKLPFIDSKQLKINFSEKKGI